MPNIFFKYFDFQYLLFTMILVTLSVVVTIGAYDAVTPS